METLGDQISSAAHNIWRFSHLKKIRIAIDETNGIRFCTMLETARFDHNTENRASQDTLYET